MRKKFDEETAARKREEERAREARRNQMASAPPSCVIKPVMSGDDLAKCRGAR